MDNEKLPFLSQQISTLIFALAILHTFAVAFFRKLSHKYPKNSAKFNLLHLLGEVEVVFPLYAGAFVIYLMSTLGKSSAVNYMENLNYTEPLFVFVILVICGTKPILRVSEQFIFFVSRMLFFIKPGYAFYLTALVVGPLLGSFITEPAAMTVTALVLLNQLYSQKVSEKFKYATIGLLFVNVSIGGTLTHFAAPPVLMVASKWNWDLTHMLLNFGDKAALACFVSTLTYLLIFKKELAGIKFKISASDKKIPLWVTLSHLLTLVAVIVFAHDSVIFMGILLFFFALTTITKTHQEALRLKESLLVASFLAGLVVLGSPQAWWLEPFIKGLDYASLFIGATALTAITDNAALTYLGSLIPDISDNFKYALVAGAVTGGGLTVIANAPNPAGFGILQQGFKGNMINPLYLFLAALYPTLIAALAFWFL
jgi:hypothetical protein